jgi:hypothetical protein
MTTRQPGLSTPLDDLVAWRDQAIEEAWEMAAFDDDADTTPLVNAFQITDLQHWLDLCA